MPVTVRFDPTVNSVQAQVIQDATPFSDGVMSKAQATKLAGLTPGGGTIAEVYANGASAADQTATVAAGNGGGIVLQSAVAVVGSLLRALTSASVELFNIIDAAIPKVNLAGTFVQNDPGFGSPVMGAQTPGSFMSYTADGVGSDWGGTGVTVLNDAHPEIVMTLSDTPCLQMFPVTGSLTDVAVYPGSVDDDAVVWLGYQAAPGVQQYLKSVASELYDTQYGGALVISSNTIVPTTGQHSVGAGLIKTITPPYASFSGTIALAPTAAFTYDGTGNILVAAGSGTAVVNRTMFATYNGTTWTMSY